MRKSLLSMLVILMLTLAACAPQATEEAMGDEAAMQESPTEEVMSSDDEMMADEDAMDEHSTSEADSMDDDTMMDESKDDDAMMDESMDDSSEDAMMELPAWFMADLVNVNTGESFKIEDYSGKVVLVETMAIWCSTCLSQQRQVQALHGTLGDRDDFVSVALDIDINETGDALGQYSAQQGFDWVYAIAPAEVAREIGDLYGQQYLNPPSAPMFIIDRSGKAHPLPFGVKSADELQQAIEPFLSEGM